MFRPSILREIGRWTWILRVCFFRWFVYGFYHVVFITMKKHETTPVTLWKFNIAPENIPSQKEISLPTIIFQGLCWTLGVHIGMDMPLSQDMFWNFFQASWPSESKTPQPSIFAAALLPLLCAVTDLLSCFFHLNVAKGTNRKRILSFETKAKHENTTHQSGYTVP